MHTPHMFVRALHYTTDLVYIAPQLKHAWLVKIVLLRSLYLQRRDWQSGENASMRHAAVQLMHARTLSSRKGLLSLDQSALCCWFSLAPAAVYILELFVC